MTQIFVPGIGQFDNIGDIILRRQLLTWLRPLGTLHVYVGNSPPGYAEALGVPSTEFVYRSFRAWYAAGIKAAASGDAAYVAKPGEIQLTVKGMKEHVSVAPLLALIRARGGAVIRVGAGSRNFAPLPRLLMKPAIGLSSLVRWRDPVTADYLGGQVMPDLAFGEVGTSTYDGARDTVAISLRSDRPMPPTAWFDAIRQFAQERALTMVVVTQVLRDRERSAAVADLLGAELADWDGTEHDGQEQQLRDGYRRSALVVSDRLHVLIAALTEGARVVAPFPEGSAKIERHFDAVGVGGVAIPTAGMDAAAIVAALNTALDRPAADLTPALRELDDVRQQVATLITASGRSPVAAGQG